MNIICKSTSLALQMCRGAFDFRMADFARFKWPSAYWRRNSSSFRWPGFHCIIQTQSTFNNTNPSRGVKSLLWYFSIFAIEMFWLKVAHFTLWLISTPSANRKAYPKILYSAVGLCESNLIHWQEFLILLQSPFFHTNSNSFSISMLASISVNRLGVAVIISHLTDPFLRTVTMCLLKQRMM